MILTHVLKQIYILKCNGTVILWWSFHCCRFYCSSAGTIGCLHNKCLAWYEHPEPQRYSTLNASPLLNLTALMIFNLRVCANLQDGLMYTWISVSAYVDASPRRASHAAHKTCVELHHPFWKAQQQFKLQFDVKRSVDCQHVLNKMRDPAHVFDLKSIR